MHHDEPTLKPDCWKPGGYAQETLTIKLVNGCSSEHRRASKCRYWIPASSPPCSKPAELEPQDVFTTEHREFKNYPGVEDQQITDDELAAHLDKHHIAAFDSLEELKEFVKGDCALNKLGLIVKTRNGVTKARMILDTKQSRVKHASTQSQRVTLPRPFDAILHLLYLMTISMACASAAEGLAAFVLDFSDAFWQVPLLQQEFKYYCATGLIRGLCKWIAFLRAPQGSSAAPTLWGRVAALLMRLTQSLIDPDELRLVCYVDDPLAAIRGTPERRRLLLLIRTAS